MSAATGAQAEAGMKSGATGAEPDVARDDDGVLEAWELLGMSTAADIVICADLEWPAGTLQGADGITGLSWSWLVAGAPAIVVSRWPTPAPAREIPLAVFFRGLFENALEPGELIAAVALPASAPRTASAFLKLETNANDLAIISVAVRLTLGAGGTCVDPRIVLGGGVGETYVRAAHAEAALAEAPAAAAASAAAADAVADDFEPVTDHRASAEYRRHIAGVYLRRALATALQRLG